MLQPVLMEADIEDEAASELRITLEVIGLCTENYLVPDCSDQSPNKGCGVVPGPSGCGPCPVPHPGWAAEVAALSPSKAPGKGLEVPKVDAVVGSLGQVPGQGLCPCSEQEGSEVKACHSTGSSCCPRSKNPIHTLPAPCVPSSTLPTHGLAGCSHDFHILQILTPDHLGCTAPPALQSICCL